MSLTDDPSAASAGTSEVEHSTRTSPMYSTLQVQLHWIVVLLVLLQLWSGDAMEGVMRTLERQQSISATQFFMSSIHGYGGLSVLCLMLWRLYLRMRLMSPRVDGAPEAGSTRVFMPWLAKLNHFALYALIFLLGTSGALTYFTEFARMGVLHRYSGYLFQCLALLHIAAALYHAIVRRDDVFARMWRWRLPKRRI